MVGIEGKCHAMWRNNSNWLLKEEAAIPVEATGPRPLHAYP